MTKLVNRAKMTTATTGTGAITLGSAVGGYQTFAAAGVANGDVVRYVIEDGSEWEIGTGTYTASGTTLTRTVEESSNSDAALNLSGSAVVYVSATDADFREEAVGEISGAATLDLSTGSVFDYTPAEDTTFNFANPPAAGTAQGFTLKLTGAEVTTSYDIANASYDNVSFDVSSEDNSPSGLTFNNDGTKMYIIGYTSDSVHQYSLSTAFDLSTASYDSVSFSVASGVPFDLAFNNDGTKMYIVEVNSVSVYQYSLSTGFDLSTASYDNVSFSVFSQDATPTGLAFNNDGTKMYIVGDENESVYQYSLSTAFDLSTASYDSVSFNVSSEDGNPYDLVLNNDGTKMYILGEISDTVYQYSLSTSFDLSTASYDSVSFSVASEDTLPYSISFNNDGTKMYMLGFDLDVVYQYSTTTTFTPSFTYPASVQWPGGTAPDSPAVGETDVLTFYTQDGGTTYYGMQAGDNFS